VRWKRRSKEGVRRAEGQYGLVSHLLTGRCAACRARTLTPRTSRITRPLWLPLRRSSQGGCLPQPPCISTTLPDDDHAELHTRLYTHTNTCAHTHTHMSRNCNRHRSQSAWCLSASHASKHQHTYTYTRTYASIHQHAHTRTQMNNAQACHH